MLDEQGTDEGQDSGSCALSAKASEDRDIVASCDTNATGLSALTVDELSLSRGDCDASDDAIKLRSSRDCATPGEGSSSQTCIWAFFDMTSCILIGKWLQENTDTSRILTSRRSLSHR